MIIISSDLFKPFLHFSDNSFDSHEEIQSLYLHFIRSLKADPYIIRDALSLAPDDYFIFYGSYLRHFTCNFDMDIPIRIQRIKVIHNDGSFQTHALIPCFLVPYSTISFSIHFDAVMESRHCSLHSLAHKYEVDLHSLKIILAKYHSYWSHFHKLRNNTDRLKLIHDIFMKHRSFYFLNHKAVLFFCHLPLPT